MNYVNHHNPDLILFDSEGDELQRIDLTRLRTTQNIHKLLKMFGMREMCKDDAPECDQWAKSGQCDVNPSYMYVSCRKACAACEDVGGELGDGEVPCVNSSPDNDCEYWSTMGECSKNEAFMKTACARSCGVCKVFEKPAPADEDDEFDKDEL